VRLFTDGRDTSNLRQQALEEQKFNTVALPLYAVVNSRGATRAVTTTRSAPPSRPT